MVFGFDDAVGCAAFARDIAIKGEGVSAHAKQGGEDVWVVKRGRGLQIDDFSFLVLHGKGFVS